MKTSETITKITPAFLEAQKEIESVIKDSTNPFFHSKYADLTAVIEACKDKLNKQSIAILQPIDGHSVETILIHTSGEWFASSTPIVVKSENDPQALGSAITYAKRYGLQSMVLLPAADDDGNAAATPAYTPRTGGVPTKTIKKAAGAIGVEVCSMEDCTTPYLAVPPEVVKYSMDKWKKVVCYKCQQRIK